MVEVLWNGQSQSEDLERVIHGLLGNFVRLEILKEKEKAEGVLVFAPKRVKNTDYCLAVEVENNKEISAYNLSLGDIISIYTEGMPVILTKNWPPDGCTFRDDTGDLHEKQLYSLLLNMLEHKTDYLKK